MIVLHLSSKTLRGLRPGFAPTRGFDRAANFVACFSALRAHEQVPVLRLRPVTKAAVYRTLGGELQLLQPELGANAALRHDDLQPSRMLTHRLAGDQIHEELCSDTASAERRMHGDVRDMHHVGADVAVVD